MTPPWGRARRVLAVRLDTMGDVLMTTPAVRALRGGAAGRTITLLTSPAGAAVAALVPEVDDCVVYDAPWMKAAAPRTSAEPDHAMIETLKRGGFEAAVIFTVFSQSPLPAALLCHLAGIPLRLAICRENPYQLLTERVLEIEPEQGIRHEVRRHLDLVAAIGCHTEDERLSLAVPADAMARIDARLAALDLLRDDRWAVIHPGATAPSRRYPAEGFAAAAATLAREHGFRLVVTGEASELPLAETILAAAQGAVISFAGCLGLAELAALIARAPLLISNNTGPVHIAAALGTPVVDLYALTNPQHTPWQVPHRVLSHDVPCRYCFKSICPEGHHECLRRIAPAAVVAAALDLLAEAQRRTA